MLRIILPSQVGDSTSYDPAVDDPSPPHVTVTAPAKPNPVAQVNVHALPKLCSSVQVTESPFSGAAKAGQVIAETQRNFL